MIHFLIFCFREIKRTTKNPSGNNNNNTRGKIQNKANEILKADTNGHFYYVNSNL